MFALAATLGPIKFPRRKHRGMCAFNELLYTIRKKRPTIFFARAANHSGAERCKNRGVSFKIGEL